MLPGFIASLIKRWPAPGSLQGAPSTAKAETAEEVAARDAAIVKRVATFWHDVVRFVPLDDLIRSNTGAPEISLEEAGAGHVQKLTRSTDTAPAEIGNEGRDVTVAIGLAPRDWHRLRGQSSRAHYLLAIPARLTVAGSLLPCRTEVPFFNPTYIQSNNQRNDVFITTPERVSAWMDAHPLPPIEEWPPLWAFALQMLCGAIFNPVSSPAAAIETITQQLGIAEPRDWIVKVMSTSISNKATAEIERLYSHLLDRDEALGCDARTFERLVLGCGGVPALQGEPAARADTEVLGHIDAFKSGRAGYGSREIFPLDPLQRQVVRHACRLGVGEVLAVNGPPGTGKTATLRAIIASYWVRAALDGGRPPIIVGCGATNQAVTNITEAFIDAPHLSDDYALAQRWNPFVSSYGMFFASDNFAENNPDKVRRYQAFQFAQIKDRCLLTLREARNPFAPGELVALTDYYLRMAATCDAVIAKTVAGVTAELQVHLRQVAIEWPQHLHALIARAKTGVRCEPFTDPLIAAHIAPRIGRQNDFVQQQVFKRFTDYLRAPSSEPLQPFIDDGACDEAEAARLLTEAVIDSSLRPHAFHIAARYWEGRFLEAAVERLHTRTEENVIDALQRMCMLAPCIVSTISSLPRLFGVDYVDPDKPRHFAYGAADLLIMDESGQALPETGAACFALTKRALIVGDLQQLEPVAAIQPHNEIALLGRRNNAEDYLYLVKTDKAPSSGAVLAMAQRASSYHDRFKNGLTLLFHYRCVQPIIGYCNRLSYGGHLRARTADGADQWPPPLAWVAITNDASRRGGSWVNEREAREIAGWLRSSWPRLAGDGRATLSAMVAVLSAFRPQIDALRTAIGEAFDDRPTDLPPGTPWPSREDVQIMTIGTVHSLQGAERPIVIFSGTVSSSNSAAPFFDSSASILNVAVSRAKKSFIYFGDTRHLFRHDREGNLTSGKPSAILGDHMRQHRLARPLYPLYLVIVEAPGKSRAISEILGTDYRIVATGGSIREIDAGELGLGFDRGLRPRWRWREGPGKLSYDSFLALAREVDQYDAVFVATDADMEGEAIAWHVIDALASIAGPQVWDIVRRVRLGDITRTAVLKAFGNPGSLDRHVAAAAIARAIADRLIAGRLSAETNRVPSPAEAEREAAIKTKLGAIAVSAKRPRTPRHHPGRVQAGVLRLVADAADRGIEQTRRLGRFRVRVIAIAEGHTIQGYLVLPDREYRIDAPDIETARQRLSASIIARLPLTLASYEHDGIEKVNHGARPPPFLSTIELMRRAVGYGLMPWDTMEALQNLYLGRIMKHEYLGETEE